MNTLSMHVLCSVATWGRNCALMNLYTAHAQGMLDCTHCSGIINKILPGFFMCKFFANAYQRACVVHDLFNTVLSEEGGHN